MNTQKVIRNFKYLGTGLSLALLISTIYNSVQMGNENFINTQDTKFVKRLDELNGTFEPGHIQHDEISLAQATPVKVEKKKPTLKKTVAAAPAPQAPRDEKFFQPAIKEEKDLVLVEFFNARKYNQVLKNNSVDGSLYVDNGTIQSFEVELPEGESISIVNADLKGNTFEYMEDGFMRSGLIYEAGKGVYMVTLTTGNYEGSRLKFQDRGLASQVEEPVQNQEFFNNERERIAEENNVEPLDYLEQQEEPLYQDDYNNYEQEDIADNRVEPIGDVQDSYGFTF